MYSQVALLTAVSRDRTHRTGATTQSRPVDPDQVAALLQQCAERDRLSSPAPSLATTASSLPEGEQYQQDLQKETRCYNALVEAGGRPSHPLSRLGDIVKDPGEYRDILSFWQRKSQLILEREKDEWKVFSSQLVRWHDFRRLQRYAREQSAYDHWRSVWEDGCKMRHAKWEGNEDAWERSWQWRDWHEYGDRRVVFLSGYTLWWEFVKRKGRAVEGQGFPEYVEALKERLGRHGFTRTFQLDEDLVRQDKLTTWIEYLGYEYWWYDQSADFVEHYQQQHDDAWKKLVDSKVLKAEETEEVLRDTDAAYQRASERERAEKALQSAISAVSSAERALSKSNRSRLSIQELRRRLLVAQFALKMAKNSYDSIKRRNAFITEFMQRTRDYRIAKRDAERHSVLLRWILQQVPLIELELNQPSVARENSEQRDSTKKRKRLVELDKEQLLQEQRRDESDRRSVPDLISPTVSTSRGGDRTTAGEQDRSFKQRKYNGRKPRLPDLPSSGRPTSNSLDVTTIRKLDLCESTARPGKARVKDSKASLDPSSRISQPLRRSKRIAKRLNNTTISSFSSITHFIQRTKLAQVPMHSSIKEGKADKAISRTSTRRSRLKRSGSNTLKSQRVSKRSSRSRL